MNITIKINTDNAAFDGREGVELAHVLTSLAGVLSSTDATMAGIPNMKETEVIDTYGEPCGSIEITEATQ